MNSTGDTRLTRTGHRADRWRRAMHDAGAYTLAECLLAVLVLLVISLAVGSALVAAQQEAREAANIERGMDLAVELMQRVVSLPYRDGAGIQTPGPEAGETSPASFDNMDDYHGYSEAAGQIKDPTGTLMPAEYQTFSRSVTVQYGSATVAGLGTVQGLTVTVTVNDGRGSSWSVARFVPAGL